MEGEISTSVRLSLELLICAVLVSIVSLCFALGYGLYEGREEDKEAQQLLQDKSKFYYYDDRSVTGDDAIELIMKYTRDYDYYFAIYDSNGNLVQTFEMSKDDEKLKRDLPEPDKVTLQEYWSEASIRKTLEGWEGQHFNASLIKGHGNSYVTGILFEYVG